MKPHAPGAVAALILGILALMLCSMPLVGLGLGIAAIVNGRRARRALAVQPDLYLHSGIGQAGLVCGIIGTVFSALSTLWLMFALILFAAVLSTAAGAAGAAPPHTPML